MDDCTELLADCDTTTRFLKLSIFDTESDDDVCLDGFLLTNIYPTAGFSNQEFGQTGFYLVKLLTVKVMKRSLTLDLEVLCWNSISEAWKL